MCITLSSDRDTHRGTATKESSSPARTNAAAAFARARARTIGLSGAAVLAALVASLVAAVPPSGDDVASLAARLQSAQLIVLGEAGTPEVVWDGSDSASIRTLTPFHVRTVVKGALASHDVVLSQPGGEIAGQSRLDSLAAQFDRGDVAFVLLGDRSLSDHTFSIPAGLAGVYRVTVGSDGAAGVDLRLGLDARSFSSREKAPGALLYRLSMTEFERLARDDTGVATRRTTPTQTGSSLPRSTEYAPPRTTDRAVRSDEGLRSEVWWFGLGFAAAVSIAVAYRKRRRRPGRNESPAKRRIEV